MAWNRVALPSLALLPLASAPHLCRRLLQAPGVAPPLARLHNWLALLQCVEGLGRRAGGGGACALPPKGHT